VAGGESNRVDEPDLEGSPVRVDTLITGGLVVTMDSDRRVIEDGAVAFSGDRIAFVGTREEAESIAHSATVVDAKRKAVLPGLIDAHAHAGHSLVKTIGAHQRSRDWLRMIEEIYFQWTTPEFWHADGMLSALEKAHFGITCGVMMLGNQPRTDDPAYADAFVRGASQVGTRTVLSVGPPSPPWPKTFTRWEGDQPQKVLVTHRECMNVTEDLVQRWHGSFDGRVRVMLGPSYLSVPSPHDAFFSADHLKVAVQQAADLRALATRYKVLIHTHAYGGVIENASAYLNGFLGPDVLLAHCTGISDSECNILSELDVKVAHCPKARRVYTGRCPVPELLDAGVTVAVASDAGAPDRTFDLFEAMRTAQRLQRVHFADARYLPPGKMLESVTIDAARAIGMAEQIGSLEVGKRADVILIDLWRPHMVPTFMPLWRLVHEACGHDVTDVFVDGKLIVADGRCRTVDEDDVLGTAESEAGRMVERAGLQSLMAVTEGFWGRSRY
jgi:5-methylthioadenosine/S-adenosylhomocysteine deaminase